MRFSFHWRRKEEKNFYLFCVSQMKTSCRHFIYGNDDGYYYYYGGSRWWWMVDVDGIVREIFCRCILPMCQQMQKRRKKITQKFFSLYLLFGSCDEDKKKPQKGMDWCNFYNVHKYTLQTNTIFVYWELGAWDFLIFLFIRLRLTTFCFIALFKTNNFSHNSLTVCSHSDACLLYFRRKWYCFSGFFFFQKIK